MWSVVRKVFDLCRARYFWPNGRAASVIRDFARGTQKNPYAWDAFESVTHTNTDVDLALRLCWYFASRYPAQSETEYCANEAIPYFLAIADALEQGVLHSCNCAETVAALKAGHLPESLRRLLKMTLVSSNNSSESGDIYRAK